MRPGLLALAVPLFSAFGSGPPVLDYSARFGGSGEPRVEAAAIDRNGRVYVAGAASTDEGLFVAVLSPDGAALECNMRIGAAGGVHALALGPDGTAYVLGYTASAGFPVTAGPRPGEWSRFLMRLDPCRGAIVYSRIILAGAAAAGGLAVDGAGGAVAALPLAGAPPAASLAIEPAAHGVVLRFSPQGEPLAAASLAAELAAAAMDGDGAVSVAGRGPESAPGLVVAKLASDLRSAVYIRRIGSAPIRAASIAAGAGGEVWVTGGTEGGGFPVTPGAAFTAPAPYGAFLVKLDRAGELEYSGFASSPGEPGDRRRGIGVALDAAGRIYVAEEGQHRLPDVGPLRDRVPVAGARIHVFRPDGSPDEEGVLVPSNWTFGVSSPFAFAFDGERRAVLATAQSASPVTPGSLSTDAARPLSVLRFDYGASGAPALLTDAEMLTFTVIPVASGRLEGSVKRIQFGASDGSAVLLKVAVVPEPASGRPQAFFSAPDQAVTPAEVEFTAPEAPHRTVAVAAAAGLRGGLRVVPLISAAANPLLRAVLEEQFDIAEPSSAPLTGRLLVTAAASAWYGTEELSLPFQTESGAPWLTVDPAEGVTPAALRLTADPSGLPPGVHTARLTLRREIGPPLAVDVRLRIGNFLRLAGAPGRIILAAGSAPAAYQLRLTSTAGAAEFRVQSQNDWIEVSPASGSTPADLVLTVHPARMPGPDNTGFFSVSSPGAGSLAVPVSALIVTDAQPPAASPSVDSLLAPGAILHVSGLFPCSEAEAAPPWPAELGGCSVRIGGATLPVGMAAPGWTVIGTNRFPTCSLRVQAPYDLAGTAAVVEVTAGNRPLRTGQLAVAAAAPRLLDAPGTVPPGAWILREDGSLAAHENPVRAGEIVTCRITGFGRTEPAIPAGALPPEDAPVSPSAVIEAFIGGRRAEVISAELSKSEVGVAIVQVRIPPIRPDDHPFLVRAAGAETTPAALRVVR